MRKGAVLSAVLTVAAVVAALLIISPAPPANAAAVKIMPLGDSITGSPGCWRALLWQRLQNTGHTNIDFVGTLPAQGCGFPYDGENEGHGGFLATNVADQNQLVGWLAATLPDIVIMHFGTNDVWNNRSPDVILAAFSKLVDQMRASKATMKILVAKIIPMNPSNCAECGQRVVTLNNAIPGWAAGKSTAQSPITVVDQWTGFSTAADTFDGVHPNDSGNQKMSDKWFQPLVDALGSTPPTSTTTTTTRTTTTTTTTTNPPPGCAAAVNVVNSWPGQFQIDLVVRNTGTTSFTGWAVRFALASGMTLSQAWNTEVTQSLPNITARNVGWNATIAPATSVTVGMIINGNPAGWTPAPVC
jgi:lysophospholipase L1-like esterase